MQIDKKVSIILEEIDQQAVSIPAYMEKYYIKAVTAALIRIDREGEENANQNYRPSL